MRAMRPSRGWIIVAVIVTVIVIGWVGAGGVLTAAPGGP
jgi:hypothetical protein